MHTLLNNGWSFALLPTGSTSDEARRAVFEPVDLPHDWLIHDPDRLYESGDGWYRRGLTLSEFDLAGHVFLSFDGVYMDTDVYLNGTLLLTERYGYAPFQVDLTPFALAGANEILLHVRYLAPNSRWYSGAGIFRDVELLLLPETCFVPDGICAQTIWESDGSWSLRISAEILGSQKVEAAFFLLDGDQTIVSATSDAQARIALRLPCPGVMPWSPKCPKCYTLVCSLGDQKETVVIGFRHITLDPERGLFLNQTSVKLHGVCLHHDLGCLGAAFHPEAAERQLTCLMSIGVNAIRTSHNPPARAFLDLCDRLGLLVMDEAFDMWEGPKTRYDYARFFAAHAGEDLRRMVRRDRNHPCVIFWSIGNEIQDTHLSPAAPRMTRFLRDTVRASDGGHAPITIGSNYMPWKGAQRCADVLKIAGYNYAEKLYASHHAAHPEWVIYGSETASVLSSRGIYHFPISASILSDEDEQCSALGNSVTSWGHQYLPRMLADDLNCPWTLGQFVWSGTDYIGEPTPYHTRSSYFGLFDTACLPKDSAYLYRAAWTDSPFVHIGVSWSWNEGQMIDVPVMTNTDAVELFLGDTSLGKREVCMRDPEKALPVWHLPFQPLPLRAVIETNGEKGKKVIEDVRWPYGDCDHLHVLRESAPAGALAFLQVEARDREDHPVENAVNLVTVRTRGPIRVLGMDNGDSTDHDGYLTLGKRLFSGRLLIVLQATAETGEGVVTLASEGLRDVQLTLPLNAAFRGTPPEGSLKPFPVRDTRLYARAIRLTPMGSTTLTPQHPSVTFTVSVLPENSFPQPITYRVTNTAGIDSPCAKVEVRQDQGTVTVLGCGDGDLFLRATVTN